MGVPEVEQNMVFRDGWVVAKPLEFKGGLLWRLKKLLKRLLKRI